MAKYKFEVRTATHVMLSQTAELAGHEEARIEASHRVGALLDKHAREIWVDEDWRMDVTDESGLILFALHVSAVRAPATWDDEWKSS
jgi:hypothetical protein